MDSTSPAASRSADPSTLHVAAYTPFTAMPRGISEFKLLARPERDPSATAAARHVETDQVRTGPGDRTPSAAGAARP